MLQECSLGPQEDQLGTQGRKSNSVLKTKSHLQNIASYVTCKDGKMKRAHSVQFKKKKNLLQKEMSKKEDEK